MCVIARLDRAIGRMEMDSRLHGNDEAIVKNTYFLDDFSFHVTGRSTR